MGNFQPYDIVILILVGWLTLRGAMKGMVSQLASIAAVVVSFWAAVRFGPFLEPVIQSNFNAQSPWNKVLALTVAFVGASIAVMFLHRIVTRIISFIRMRKFDRLCGALFGFLKGVLIGMIITFFAVMLSEQTRVMATQSFTGKILVRLIQHSQSLLPEDVSSLIESNLEGFMKQIHSSEEMADGTLSQAKTASQMITGAKNAVELFQSGITLLSQRSSGDSDPADLAPILSNDHQKNGESEFRDYPIPVYNTFYQPPSTSETDQTNEQRTSVIGQPQSASIPVGQNDSGSSVASSPVSFSPSVTPTVSGGSTVTNPTPARVLSSAFVVAPSADMLPMTSTATPSVPAVTDWRTLLREMR